MAEQEKRIHELIETADKTGKYIVLDEAGLSEALKFDADLLVDKAYTDTLYVKLVGDEAVNGVKTWNDQGVFGAGINVTSGDLNVETGSQLIKAGKLGIGVTSNTYKFEVSDNSTTVAASITNTNASGFGMTITGASTTNYILKLNDYLGNGRFIVQGDGKIGIGIETPSTLLHVYSTQDTSIAIDSNTNSPYIVFKKAGVSKYTIALERDTPTWGGAANDLIFYNDNLTQIDLIIKSITGYVGIGTPTPGTKFDVSGSFAANWISSFTNTSISGDGVLITAGGTTGTRYILFLKDYADNDRFVFTDTGEFGIGTITPGFKLQINDNSATITSVIENSNASGFGMLLRAAGGANYILFLKDYTEAGRFIVLGNGSTGIGISAPTDRLQIKSAGISTTMFSIERSASTQKIVAFTEDAAGGGGLTIGSPSIPSEIRINTNTIMILFPIYNFTTAVGSVNIVIDSGGQIRRLTSSKTAKFLIKEDIDPNLALKFKPVSFKDKATKIAQYGFIAEQLNEVDPKFATDQNDKAGAMGVHINAVVAALTATVKKQQKELDILKGKKGKKLNSKL